MPTFSCVYVKICDLDFLNPSKTLNIVNIRNINVYPLLHSSLLLRRKNTLFCGQNIKTDMLC